MNCEEDIWIQRMRFVAMLRAWMASKSEAIEDMECIVAAYAHHIGLVLRRRELATAEEVMAVQCPRHGWDPCWREWDGGMMRRGCLARQVEALRSDYFPPQQTVAVGALDDGSCIDGAAMEVHHGA